MASDSRLAVVIFAVLALCIAVPWVMWRNHEARRPELLAARVVTATAADPVFRDGVRRLAPAEEVRIATAVKLGRFDGSTEWFCPGERLELVDDDVEHVTMGGWPEEDRRLRVFWFTIESAFLGGELTPERCEKLLAYRSFLAPELGQEMIAEGIPEYHNDDHLGTPDGMIPVTAGTIRLYARVELIDESGDLVAEQAVSTLGADQLTSAALPTLLLSGDFPPPIHTAAGELFGLPGFEAPAEHPGGLDEIAAQGCGISFSELVTQRRAASSASFAAVAVFGVPELDPQLLPPAIAVEAGGVRVERRGRPLHWGTEVHAGDLLQVDQRWIVLTGDDGNGVLDRADTVLMCWKAPAMALDLGHALGPAPGEVRLLRTAAAP